MDAQEIAARKAKELQRIERGLSMLLHSPGVDADTVKDLRAAAAAGAAGLHDLRRLIVIGDLIDALVEPSPTPQVTPPETE